MCPKRQLERTWIYPPIGAALATVGLDNIGVYISFCHNTVEQYIATYPITDLCMAVELRPGMRLLRIWWEKPDLDILGIRAGHLAVETGEETGTEESKG